jgi:hypothetical protein
MLRAVVLSATTKWDLTTLLDVVDERTLRRLLARSGLRDNTTGSKSTAHFLNAQAFVDNSLNIAAVAHELSLRGWI